MINECDPLQSKTCKQWQKNIHSFSFCPLGDKHVLHNELKTIKCVTIFQPRLSNFRNELLYQSFCSVSRKFYAVAWSTAWETHLGGVKSGAVTRGNATSEKAHFIQWGVLVHLGQRDVSHYGVLREGARPHEVKHFLSLASEAWCPIREQAPALGYSAGKRWILFIYVGVCMMKLSCCTLHCRAGRSSVWWWLSFDFGAMRCSTKLLTSQRNVYVYI